MAAAQRMGAEAPCKGAAVSRSGSQVEQAATGSLTQTQASQLTPCQVMAISLSSNLRWAA